MYAPQAVPAVYFLALASSVIIVAARASLLPPCVVPALGFRFHIPKLLAEALFLRWCLLGLLLSVDLPLPCGQITVVLLYEDRSLVIQSFVLLTDNNRTLRATDESQRLGAFSMPVTIAE